MPQNRMRGEPLPNDAAGLKDFFTRRLEEARQSVARLEALLTDLNKGGDIAAIRKRFEEQRGDRRQNNPQREGLGGERRNGIGPDGKPRPDGMGGEGGRGFEIFQLVGGPKLSPEEHARVAEMLRTEAPALHDRIQTLAGQNQVAADRLIDGLGGRMRGLLGVREHDPEEFKLRMQELEGSLDIMKYKGEIEIIRKQGGDEAKSAAAKSNLKEAVGRQFDLRMELSARQITQLRKHADKVQTDLDKTKADKQKVVDETTEKLLKARRPEGGKPPGPRPDGPPPGEPGKNR